MDRVDVARRAHEDPSTGPWTPNSVQNRPPELPAQLTAVGTWCPERRMPPSALVSPSRTLTDARSPRIVVPALRRHLRGNTVP